LTAPEPAGSRHRHVLAGVVGVAVSLALLAWAMRDVNLAQVGTEIRRAHPGPLIIGIVVATASFMVRAFRWGLLLRDDHGQPVPLAPRWHSVAMGFMANNVLPFRVGEVLRAYAITKLGHVRFAGSIASLVVERVFDALTLVLLLSIGLLWSGLPTSTVLAGVTLKRIGTVTAIGGLFIVLIGIVIVARPTLLEGLLRRILPDGGLRRRLISLANGISDGLGVLRSPARVLALVAWSLGMWLASAFSFWIMFRAFDIDVPFAGAVVLQSTMAFAISVPSTPGYIGPFEAVIVAVLGLYGVPDTTAFSYAVTYHLTTLLPITLMGLWSLVRTPVALGDLKGPAPS
jgi:uncharacterized protein (TIRG00374 family)